jgi:hypothetical protein
MILPSQDFERIRLVRIPEDFEQHEVYRYVTGLIAEIEEENPDVTWHQIAESLEDHGFETLDFILGPALD